MTASATHAKNVAQGMRGFAGPGVAHYNILRNFNKEVDGADVGTPAAASTKVFTDTRSIAASGTDLLDLNGGVATFAKVHVLIVHASKTNTNDVVVGGAGSNTFVGPFGAAAHTLHIQPGQTVVLSSTVGWTVTAGTADILELANGSSGSAVSYDIAILAE